MINLHSISLETPDACFIISDEPTEVLVSESIPQDAALVAIVEKGRLVGGSEFDDEIPLRNKKLYFDKGNARLLIVRR